MSDGRTVWWAKDSAWWRRERIVELAEEFGPSGPAVIDWLSCEAKAQNNGGIVKTGYRSIARGAFVELSTVCPLVSRAVLLGLLDDFEEDGRTFTCRISGWYAEQERVREAQKKAAQRARDKAESRTNTDDPGGDTPGPNGTRPPVSPDVPESPPTGQDRTEEEVVVDARAEDRRLAAVHPDLGAVLAILEALPDVLVEPASIASAMSANPTKDAVAAAHRVASIVHGGQNRTAHTNSILMSVLQRMPDKTETDEHADDDAALERAMRGAI